MLALLALSPSHAVDRTFGMIALAAVMMVLALVRRFYQQSSWMNSSVAAKEWQAALHPTEDSRRASQEDVNADRKSCAAWQACP